MYRAHLYSKSSEIPPLGSPKDRILAELYFRNKILEKEKYEVLFSVAAKMFVGKLDNQAVEAFTTLLNKITGAYWIKNSDTSKKEAREMDFEMLNKIKTLQPKALKL